MSELFNKKDYLKDLIIRSKKDNTDSIRKELKEAISNLSADEIAKVEQELIENESINVDDIQSVCDVHLELFRDYIKQEDINVPAWHPIDILMKEHDFLLEKSDDLRKITKEIISNKADLDFNKLKTLGKTLEDITDAENYFIKEENVLFPYLEKYGIEQPPAIMWKEHDQLRELIKEIKSILDKREMKSLNDDLLKKIVVLNEMFANHIYKEHSVLFPTALKLLEEQEWYEVRNQFDDFKYIAHKPEKLDIKKDEVTEVNSEGIKLPSGSFSAEELMSILNTIPFDITFVDANDRVKYFSEGKERFFPRSRAIIGRKVHNCHPQKSVDIVEKIVSDFKSGERDNADFWIKLGDNFVYIRYFAVRNTDGEYLGTVEITQDIKPIQEIEGEKRIYDEK
ncbi:DUF438 domain-containing protein [Geotoga petraea]|uniref:DUF438 domain-containing protein n=1 Tax=Geotoga petraea TaxID=28234 RepID=A0A1G6JIE9_9BACT|nr:DUF438 domain-containing protein [Geotoga petraea]TGG88215.1 DUF438 domain-containing protein [Geotoga petraea]SDC17706.1 hypothetical protein SAMN04488588_0521 [Geotoga petraea]